MWARNAKVTELQVAVIIGWLGWLLMLIFDVFVYLLMELDRNTVIPVIFMTSVAVVLTLIETTKRNPVATNILLVVLGLLLLATFSFLIFVAIKGIPISMKICVMVIAILASANLIRAIKRLCDRYRNADRHDAASAHQ
jgi:hypothetical protein